MKPVYLIFSEKARQQSGSFIADVTMDSGETKPVEYTLMTSDPDSIEWDDKTVIWYGDKEKVSAFRQGSPNLSRSPLGPAYSPTELHFGLPSIKFP